MFVDLEKEFDCVPRKVLRWAMRTLDIEKQVILTAAAAI